MPKISTFNKSDLKRAFWEFISQLAPQQRILAIDLEHEREETTELLWRQFIEILLDICGE